MLNKIFIMGRLGHDPEVRYTQAGKPVAEFFGPWLRSRH